MSLWYKLTGALLISCLLLTACSSQQGETVSPVQDEPVEEGQVITIENPQVLTEQTAANTEDGKQYQIQTRLTDFHLLSENAGIAWGRLAVSCACILRRIAAKPGQAYHRPLPCNFRIILNTIVIFSFTTKHMAGLFAILSVQAMRLCCAPVTAELPGKSLLFRDRSRLLRFISRTILMAGY